MLLIRVEVIIETVHPFNLAFKDSPLDLFRENNIYKQLPLPPGPDS